MKGYHEFDYKLFSFVKNYRMAFQVSSKQFGLNPGQPPILMILMDTNGCTQTELCKKIRIKPASMTDVLQRMEKAGLIIREQDKSDMRATKVSITEKGRDISAKVLEINKSLKNLCFSNFTEEEMTTFLQLIEKVNGNLISHFQQQE